MTDYTIQINNNIRYLLCTKWKVATQLCIQIHLSEDFSNTNTPWSQCVQISDFRLYCMSFTYMWVWKPSSPELLNLSLPLLGSFHPQCCLELHSSRNWTCAGQLNDNTCHAYKYSQFINVSIAQIYLSSHSTLRTFLYSYYTYLS